MAFVILPEAVLVSVDNAKVASSESQPRGIPDPTLGLQCILLLAHADPVNSPISTASVLRPSCLLLANTLTHGISPCGATAMGKALTSLVPNDSKRPPASLSGHSDPLDSFPSLWKHSSLALFHPSRWSPYLYIQELSRTSFYSTEHPRTVSLATNQR